MEQTIITADSASQAKNYNTHFHSRVKLELSSFVTGMQGKSEDKGIRKLCSAARTQLSVL